MLKDRNHYRQHTPESRITRRATCTSRQYARELLSMMTDFENFTTHEQSVGTVLDQVVAWGGVPKQLR